MKSNRKIAFLGRTMLNNTEIARELGMLKVPDGAIIDLKDVPSLPPNRVCIICTGSQGETMAALSRMSRGEHPIINITAQDSIVMASSTIPGNEKVITGMLNNIEQIGARVYDSSTNNVHCSGHANQGELLYMYNVVQPRNVLPIHGEVRHLKANAQVAAQSGVDPRNIPVVLNGGVVDINNGEAKVVGRYDNGFLFVDGKEVGSVTLRDLEQRRILSQEGFIAISTAVDVSRKVVTTNPKIVARAVAEDDATLYPLSRKVKQALTRAMNDDGITETGKLIQVVRRTAGKWVARELKRSPMILPIVHTK
jgi:ribonuclease J